METRILPIPLVGQGNTPFCYYACVSMVLKYFGINKSMQDVANEVFMPNFPYHEEDNVPTNVESYYEIDAIIRDYLRDYGLDARIYRNQDWEAIKQHINLGHALIAGVRYSEKDSIPNHSWVLRGYVEDSNTKLVICNDPNFDPLDNDPVTYSTDADDLPGSSWDFNEFKTNHWDCDILSLSCVMIAVSFRGLIKGGLGFLDWRGAGEGNLGAFHYHLTRLMDKLSQGRFIEAFFESVMVGIGSLSTPLAALQILGQCMESWGYGIIDQGVKLVNSKNIGKKILGVLTTIIGAIIVGIGYVLDFSNGVGGMVCGAISGLVDGISSILSGSTSGGKKKKIGDVEVQLGVLLNVHPWRVRSGDNWEKIQGAWCVQVLSGVLLDKVEVRWEVSVGGWGIDSWSLRRHINYAIGSAVRDDEGNSTRHVKRFETEITNMSQFFMGFGEDKCKYGKDGGLVRVTCLVEAWATLAGETKKLRVEKNVYGLST